MNSSFYKSKLAFFLKIKSYYATKLSATSPDPVEFQKTARDAGSAWPGLLPCISN